MPDTINTASAASAKRTEVKRVSPFGLEARRRFDAPARNVFEAWSNPDIFVRWWTPKSMGAAITFCEMDVRTGGSYRLEFTHPAFDRPMAFFGKFLEVTPPTRLDWTNEESGDAGATTTVTLEETDGATLLTFREAYSNEAALNQAFEGSASALPEQFDQLEALLAELKTNATR